MGWFSAVCDAYDEGHLAGMEGRSECPYTVGSIQWRWWKAGYEAGHHTYCSYLEAIVANFPQD